MRAVEIRVALTEAVNATVFDGIEQQVVEEGLAGGWGDQRNNVGRMPLRTFPDSRLLFWCV